MQQVPHVNGELQFIADPDAGPWAVGAVIEVVTPDYRIEPWRVTGLSTENGHLEFSLEPVTPNAL